MRDAAADAGAVRSLPSQCTVGMCALVCVLLASALPLPAAFCQIERQTRLILPEIVPDASPELVAQLSHAGTIHSIALSPDGSRIASGGEDGMVIVRSVVSGMTERVLVGHDAPVVSLAFGPDGWWLVSADQRGTVILWDSEQGSIAQVVAGAGAPRTVAYSPDGKWIAAAGGDLPCAVWSTGDAQARRELALGALTLPPGPAAVQFSPDSGTVALCVGGGLVLWEHATDQSTWIPSLLPFSGSPTPSSVGGNPEFGSAGSSVTGGASTPSSLCYSHDGTRLAARFAGGCYVFDVASGHRLDEITVPGAVQAVGFSAGDVELCCAGVAFERNWVSMSDARGRRRRRFLEPDDAPSRCGVACFDREATVCALLGVDADSRPQIAVWDTRTAALERVFSSGGRGPLTSVAFSPNGELLAVGSANTIRMWSLATGRPEGSALFIGSVYRPPESSMLDPRRWVGGAPAAEACYISSVSALEFSPDGSRLVVRGRGGDSAACYPRNGQWVAEYRGGNMESLDGLLSLRFVREPGKGAAGTKSDHYIEVTGTGSAGAVRRYLLPTGRFDDYDGPSLSPLRFGPGEETLVAKRNEFRRSGGDALWAWHLPTSQPIGWAGLRGEQPPARHTRSRSSEEFKLKFSADGWTVAAPTDDQGLLVWRMASGEARYIPPRGGGHEVACFTPSGLGLATGHRDGTVRLVGVADLDEQAVLRGHWGPINDLAISADGHWLATASEDGAASLWDISDWSAAPSRRILRKASVVAAGILGRPVSNGVADPVAGEIPTAPAIVFMPMDRDTGWLAVTPGGYYDCSPEAASFLSWRIGERTYPFDQFSAQFQRPDLLKAALAGDGLSDAPSLDGAREPPVVAFMSPEYGSTAQVGGVDVVVEAAGVTEISSIEVTVNGRPVQAGGAAKLERLDGDGHRVRSTMRLSAAQFSSYYGGRVRAIARDQNGLQSRPAELFLQGRGAGSAPGTLHVVAIGVSRYGNPAWDTLMYAAADAESIADALTQGHRGATKQVLLDAEATVSNIKFALRQLKDETNESDTAVVFVAGHGVAPSPGEYAFLCHDTDAADLQRTAIPWQDFVSLLSEVRAGRLILLADTCHAGFVTGRDDTEAFVQRLNMQAGALVFAASRGDEASLERDDWGHGAFTKAVLEALDGQADTNPEDGTLNLRELRDYVTPRVELLTAGKQHPYLPRSEQFGDDAPIAAVRGAPVAEVRWRHGVYSIALNHAGDRMVVVGKSGDIVDLGDRATTLGNEVAVVDPVSGALVADLTPTAWRLLGRSGQIDVAISPGGTELFMVNHERALVWSLAQSTLIGFSACSSVGPRAHFAPDGLSVALDHDGGYGQRTIRYSSSLDLAELQEVRHGALVGVPVNDGTLIGLPRVVESVAESALAFVEGTRGLALWASFVRGGERSDYLVTHDRDALFAADQDRAAFAGHQLAGSLLGGGQTLPGQRTVGPLPRGKPDRPTPVPSRPCFSGDGSTLVVLHEQPPALTINVLTGEQRRNLPLNVGRYQTGGEVITGVRLNHDGTVLAVLKNMLHPPAIIELWDVANGTLTRSLEVPMPDRGGWSETMYRLTDAEFSAAGDMLVTVRDDGFVDVWDPRTGELRRTINLQELTQTGG